MFRLSEALTALKEKAEQPIKKTVVKSNDLWEKAKHQIDAEDGNYERMMTNYREYARKTMVGKLSKITVNIGEYEGFPAELIIYEGNKMKVWYVLFNNTHNTCYVRELT